MAIYVFPRNKKMDGVIPADAIQIEGRIGSSLFKGRVEQGFRVACHSPAERYSDAAEYAACKAEGI